MTDDVTRYRFGRMPGDRATYSLNDPDGAVRLAKSAPFVACDIETGSAADAGRWNVKAFSISDTSTSYVLDPYRYPDAINACLDEGKVLVFHNASYDVPILVKAGLMALDDIDKVADTLVSARLAWPDPVTQRKDLGSLADVVLGAGYGALKSALEDGFKAVNPTKSKAAMFDRLNIDSPAYVAYAAYDVILTARIYAAMPGRLDIMLNRGRPGFSSVDAALLDTREQVVNRMLIYRSAAGIRLDADALQDILDALEAESDALGVVLDGYGIDPAASGLANKRDIVSTLHARGALPASWKMLKNGTPSTAQPLMALLDDLPEVQAVVQRARIQRFRKDYGSSTEARIHPQVSVLAAVTGRMSYGHPALQQYPSAVRGMFDFGEPVTSFDWSSIEPVVIGNLAHAWGMIDPYEAGGDLYQPIADRAGISRKAAKVVLLALLYGQGAASLALRLKVTEDKARELQEAVRRALYEVNRMIRRLTQFGESYGAIQTISGRTIPLPTDPRTGNRAYLGYKATNYLIQGSAYDLLAEALYAMYNQGVDRYLYLAIHDELVVATEVADEVHKIMTTPPPALIAAAGRTPVLRVGRTDLGTHWKAKA